MKGYFSRIAKQSGIRFSTPGTGSIGGPENQPGSAASLSTIERSETIMVPPSKPKSAGDRLRQEETVKPEKSPRPAATENVRMDENAAREPAKIPDVRAGNAIDTEDFSNAGPPPAQEPRNFSEKPESAGERLVSLKDENDVASDTTDSKLAVVEKTVFVESRGDEAQIGNLPDSAPIVDGIKAPPKMQESETSDARQSPPAKKREFFAKTAELIGEVEKGEQAPAEIHNIVLREVQEWIAASPESREMPELAAAEPPEPVVLRELVQQSEPGVVRIGERPGPEISERSELSEQSFELSIGSISVVIEEPEKPPKPEPPPQRANDQNGGGDSKRGYSRLNRHYI